MKAHRLRAKITRITLTAGLLALFVLVLRMELESNQVTANVQMPTSEPLILGTTYEIMSLDPAQAYGFHNWEILRNVGTGLLGYVPGTTELRPGLAMAMPDVSSDGTVYTFTLRSGLAFPDGTPLDADAVVQAVERVSVLGGPPAWLLTSFVSEVQAPDNSTVRFVLKEAASMFPHLVASTPYFPVSPICFPSDQFDSDSTCGGLGPYTIAEWTPGISITLEANPSYPGPQAKTPDITVRYFDNASTLRQALEDGDIDVAWKMLTPTDYEQLEAAPDFDVVKGEGSFIRHLCFNTTTPPFDTTEVRTAIAAAVERESIAHQVYTDTMSPLYGTVPKGMWSHIDAFRDQYGQRDLAQARSLLEQAGYSETSKLELGLWYPEERYGPQEPNLAAELAADIEETGLVSVTLHSETWSDYLGNLGAGTMPVFLLGWWPDYADPDTYAWSFAHSTGAATLGIFYDNETMDDLLEAARSATPVQGSARRAIYEAIQELWAEEVPTIPLLQGTQMAVTRQGIRGVTTSLLGTLPYSTLWDAGFSVYLPLVVRGH
jgi:peptide/nickel transport system substrate-binding protein